MFTFGVICPSFARVLLDFYPIGIPSCFGIVKETLLDKCICWRNVLGDAGRVEKSISL